MMNMLKKIQSILKETKGESLMEGIAAILVFIVLIATVTMMILTSLRITSRANVSSEAMQNSASFVLTAELVGSIGDEQEVVIEPDTIVLDMFGDIISLPVLVYSLENDGGARLFTAFEPDQ